MSKSKLAMLGVSTAIVLGLPGLEAWAQAYPAKPVRMLVGYSAGGSTDISARLVAQKMSDEMKQPVLVENRPGAGGSIAIQAVASSPSDGYTLAMIAASATVLPSLRIKQPYDLERDMTAVSLVATTPSVLVVHPSVPARDLKELMALARSMPGKLNYASDGVGTNLHLAGALFNSMAGVSIVHVPYKGGAESAAANAGGQVQMSFPSVTSALPLLRGGKLRPIAVTSRQRAALLPEVPTFNEAGLPDFYHSAWIGLLAPANTPRDVVSLLNAMLARITNTAEIKGALGKQGLETFPAHPPEQFTAFIRSEIAQAALMVKLAGLKPE